MTRPSLSQIMAVVSEEARLPVAYIVGPMRWKDYAHARHAFVWAARDAGYTQQAIATFINRHVSTVQSSLKRRPQDVRNLDRVLNRLTRKVAA